VHLPYIPGLTRAAAVRLGGYAGQGVSQPGVIMPAS
jgi:hypothetical protein